MTMLSRLQHEETQDRLRAAAKQVGLRHLPSEPEEAMLQSYQDVVAESFRHLGFAEA